MLVHVKRDELLAIAAQTAKAAPKTATSEAVLGIHVEADSRRSMLTLTATNYEIVIRASMGASVEQSGSVVISAALFPAAISDGDGLSEQAVGHAHSGIGPASERRTLCQPTVYAAGVELRQSFPHTGRFMWTRNTNRQAGTLSVRPAIKRQPKI